MDDATRAELAELRARAYGPHPDIRPDSAALSRLRELEDAARVAEPVPASGSAPADSPGSAPTDIPGSAPADAPAPAAGHDPFAPAPPLPRRPVTAPAPAPAPEAEAASSEPPPPRSRARIVRVLWPASIAAAIVVTAVVTAVIITAPRSPGLSASQREVRTLQLANRPGQVPFEDTAGDALSALFDGLTVVRSSGVLGGNGDECLVVYQTPANGAETSPLGGPIFFGCAAGALPALVQVGVDRDSPPALRKEFPTGTGLQFRLDGDQVRVIADDSGVDHPAS